MKRLTKAQQKLVTENLVFLERVVMGVSKKFPKRIEAIELYGAGYCALCDAAQSFDPAGGACFTTWAYRPILREAIREAVWVLNWRRDENAYQRHGAPVVLPFRDDDDIEEPSDIAARRLTGPAFWPELAREYIRDVVAKLGPELRVVIEAIYFRGMEWRHADREIGISYGACMGRRKKALRALWFVLENEEEELFRLLGLEPRRPKKDIAGWCAARYSGYFRKTGRRSLPSTRKRA